MNKQNLRTIITAGVAITIFSSYSLYGFLQAFFDGFRVMSLLNELDYWFVNTSARQSYNYAFAGISTVFAYTLGMRFVIAHLDSQTHKNRIKLRRAENDQINLSWFVLFWFVSFAGNLCFVYFSLGGFYTAIFTVNPVICLTYLIAFVLFLNSWLTLLRIYRKQAHKYIVASLMLIGVVVYSVAQWSPVDYVAIDRTVKQNIPQLNNPLEYPVIVNRDAIAKKSWTNYIFLQLDSSKSPVIIADDRVIGVQDVGAYLTIKYSWHQEAIRHYLTTVVAADKNVPAKYFVPLLAEIANNTSHIAFACNSPHYASKNIHKVFRLRYPMHNIPGIPVTYEDLRDTLKILGNNTWSYNNTVITETELQQQLHSNLQKGDMEFCLTYASTTCLDDYTHTCDMFISEINSNRDVHSQLRYNMNYDELTRNQAQEVTTVTNRLLWRDIPFFKACLTDSSSIDISIE